MRPSHRLLDQEFFTAQAETVGFGLEVHQPPIVTELNPLAQPFRIWQCPMPLVIQQGIAAHIHHLLKAGVL